MGGGLLGAKMLNFYVVITLTMARVSFAIEEDF